LSLYYSFGCTAIFLIGGQTKSVKPTPLFVRDGDIIIMSESCRLFYHAVPRVFSSEDFREGPNKRVKKKRASRDCLTAKLGQKLSENLQQVTTTHEGHERYKSVQIALDEWSKSMIDEDAAEDFKIIEATPITSSEGVCKYDMISETYKDTSRTVLALANDSRDIELLQSLDRLSNDPKLDSECLVDNLKMVPNDLIDTSYMSGSENGVCKDDIFSDDYSSVYDYLSSARININVRQVFVK